jgi:hypothetical protein
VRAHEALAQILQAQGQNDHAQAYAQNARKILAKNLPAASAYQEALIQK